MQQEQIIQSTVESIALVNVPAARGPVLLDLELLSQVTGGVMPVTDLPRATW